MRSYLLVDMHKLHEFLAVQEPSTIEVLFNDVQDQILLWLLDVQHVKGIL